MNSRILDSSEPTTEEPSSLFDSPDLDPDTVDDEVAFLEWMDGNQSDILAEYANLAESYYPEIHDHIAAFHNRRDALENKITSGEALSLQEEAELGLCLETIEVWSSIIQAQRVISEIQSHKEAIDSIISGKTLSDVLGQRFVDEFRDINYDAQNEGEEILEQNMDMLSEEFMKSRKEREESDIAEHRRKIDAERERKEIAEADERLRLRILARSKKINTILLLKDIADDARKQYAFFESQRYSTIIEEMTPLKQGDFGKLILVVQSQKKEFSLVFGKRKVEYAPPASLRDAMRMTRSENIKDGSGAGFHREIETPPSSITLGGAQYVVLPDSTILIGGDSQQYGSISDEIAKRCLEASGYTVHFLNNTSYRTLSDIYHRVYSESQR